MIVAAANRKLAVTQEQLANGSISPSSTASDTPRKSSAVQREALLADRGLAW